MHVLPEMQRLVEALCETGSNVVPFIRDVHLAYRFDLEPQLQALAYRLRRPVLAEAEPRQLDALLESTPDLEQLYVTLALDEPDLTRTASILRAWAEHSASRGGRRFTAEALDEALLDDPSRAAGAGRSRRAARPLGVGVSAGARAARAASGGVGDHADDRPDQVRPLGPAPIVRCVPVRRADRCGQDARRAAPGAVSP